MAKFIQVDIGESTNAKDQMVFINLDHVTHFFTVPAEANRAEITIFKLVGGETIAALHDYKSIVHTIEHAAIS